MPAPERVEFHFLHGFLGLPTDWHEVVTTLLGCAAEFQPAKIAKLECSVHCHDLFGSGSEWFQVGNANGLWDLALRLNRKVQTSTPDLDQSRTRRVLVGYSLGGRIALHALLADPGVWDGGIIVSAHPGLLSEQDRAARVQADGLWAARFGLPGEAWESVLKAWNSQSVFAGEPGVGGERLEKDFDRAALAEAMVGCSLGLQEDLRERLRLLGFLGKQVLWVYGEKDSKFFPFGQEMVSLTESFSFCPVPGVGHRILGDHRSRAALGSTAFAFFKEKISRL